MKKEFFIDCIPPRTTNQSDLTILKNRDTGKNFIGKKANSNAKKAKQYLSLLLKPHKPDKPTEKAVYLKISWCYPWRTSDTKTTRSNGFLRCITRPDVDNLQKLLLDVMTDCGFWKDDSQVWRIEFEKYYTTKHGIKITIETD